MDEETRQAERYRELEKRVRKLEWDIKFMERGTRSVFKLHSKFDHAERNQREEDSSRGSNRRRP